LIALAHFVNDLLGMQCTTRSFSRALAVGILLLLSTGLDAKPARSIIDGSPDAVNECVGSLHGTSGFLCTGTLIDSRWVLTTAACLALAPEEFVMGADWSAPGARHYQIETGVPHPDWLGGNVNDFGMAFIELAAMGEPVCAALTPALDNLTPSSTINHVGYGLISVPSGSTTIRRIATNVIDSLSSSQLAYSLGASGPCSGDEGGPSLVSGRLVAGVVSQIDANCNVFGISDRVSSVYDSFIAPTIASAQPAVPTMHVRGFVTLLLVVAGTGLFMSRRLA
jgi:hypothetical protein